MIIKTTGIVLRLDPYSRTSQVITWLTPDHGRVVTLAKGAKRVKNNLIGQYDCYYTCELLFYQGRHSAVHVLKECSPLASRDGLRSDWRAAFSASHICALLNRLSPPGAACPAVFEWAEKTLDFIARQGATETVVLWVELKLLGLLGMAPKLDGCLGCRAAVEWEGRPLLFSIARGGVLCPACAGTRDALTMPLPQDVLAMLRDWEKMETPVIARRTSCTPGQIETASRLLGAFLDYHLDTTRSRDILTTLV